MADEGVIKILEELKLSSLIEKFKDQKIGMQVLEKLSPAVIENLIPIIGERVIFMEYWEKNFGKNQSSSPVRKRQRPNSPTTSTENASSKDFLNTLENLLKKNKDAELIKEAIESDNEKVREQYRAKLCTIIVNELYERDISMTSDVARDFAKQITNLFPNESITTYFKSPISKKSSTNNKSKVARGKLVYAWRNRKYKENKVKKVIATHEPNATNIEINQPEDSDCEDVEWLKNNQAPWDVVQKKWKKTSQIRCKKLKDSQDENLSNIFNEWNLYTHPEGFILIDIDFKNLNLSLIDLNNDVWIKFFNTIKTCSFLSNQDKTGKSLLLQLEKDLSENSKVAVALLLLAHLFPPRQMKSVSKKPFKPSIGLAKQSLLQIAKVSGDMLRIINEVKSNAATLKLKVQPYIIIIGAEDNVQEVYVNVDDTLYKVEGMLKAIDLCFKIFHVFNLEYPIVSEHLWILIQKGIYQIDLPCDQHITSIQHALSVLKRSNLEKQSNEQSDKESVEEPPKEVDNFAHESDKESQ